MPSSCVIAPIIQWINVTQILAYQAQIVWKLEPLGDFENIYFGIEFSIRKEGSLSAMRYQLSKMETHIDIKDLMPNTTYIVSLHTENQCSRTTPKTVSFKTKEFAIDHRVYEITRKDILLTILVVFLWFGVLKFGWAIYSEVAWVNPVVYGSYIRTGGVINVQMESISDSKQKKPATNSAAVRRWTTMTQNDQLYGRNLGLLKDVTEKWTSEMMLNRRSSSATISQFPAANPEFRQSRSVSNAGIELGRPEYPIFFDRYSRKNSRSSENSTGSNHKVASVVLGKATKDIRRKKSVNIKTDRLSPIRDDEGIGRVKSLRRKLDSVVPLIRVNRATPSVDSPRDSITVESPRNNLKAPDMSVILEIPSTPKDDKRSSSSSSPAQRQDSTETYLSALEYLPPQSSSSQQCDPFSSML